MLKKIKVDVFPVGGKGLFTRISDHFSEIAQLITGTDPADDFSKTRTKDREWFPEDRIMPPHCPYEDRFRESYNLGAWSAENYVKVHSASERVMGDAAYGFFDLRESGEIIFGIYRSKEKDFEKIEFSYAEKFSDQQVVEHSLKLLAILDIEEYQPV